MLSVLHRPERRCAFVLGGLPPSAEVAFVWAAVESATSYILQVGPSTGTYTTYNNNVGNVLTCSLPLAAGTYYTRVVPVGAGSPTAEQTVTVT